MLAKIRELYKKKEYKRILENMVSLTGLQFASYILPLITLPYLTWILGPDKFGLTQYAISLITYFQYFTDYGFNLSATREISLIQDNRKKVSAIFNSVMVIKIGLTIISFIIVLLIITLIPKFNKDAMVYLLTFGIVIGNMLFPTWLFQGMERMKYTTILNITGKVLFTVLIFVFIHTQQDYILVPIINSLGFLVVGILGIITAVKQFDIEFKMPTLTEITYHLKEGWHVFISTIAINMYTTTNTFLLGLLTNNTLVGYYSIAEKIVLAINGLLSPISQSLYPYISRKTNSNKKESIFFIRKITKIMALIGLLLSIMLFIFAKPIIIILFGTAYTHSVTILQILSFIPLIVALSTVFGIETMLTFNYKKAFTSILVMAGILDIILGIILIILMKEIGIAISFVISELFVTVSMFIFLQKKGIKIVGTIEDKNINKKIQ